MLPYKIELLGAKHDRSAFACGVDSLDRYLKRQAGQDAKRRIATVYVLVRVDEPAVVAGFYTLSATTVVLSDLPPGVAKRLPRYPLIPATLIGRLAVARGFQGQNLGEHLLMDALKRSFEASKRVASFAVVVHAVDHSARAFYQRYGFQSFEERVLYLFLPMESLEGLF